MSRIIGRVVLGVSGSPENLHALRHAVELARHYDATLIAVNAQPTRGRRRDSGPGPRWRGRRTPVWQQAASLVVRAAFDDALGGLPADVECVLLAAPGDPGPALVAVAGRANDVLVLGSAHRGGARRTRIARGGVAAYCIARGVCSVLTVPPPPLASVARGRARV
jgi:nucleotide-binding universal stress UspA family protein